MTQTAFKLDSLAKPKAKAKITTSKAHTTAADRKVAAQLAEQGAWVKEFKKRLAKVHRAFKAEGIVLKP